MTCYDSQTQSEVVADRQQAALRSLFEDINPQGTESVDPHFGPEPPREGDGRWIQTVPGRGWFCSFRIDGPGEPAFDGPWQPGDITPIG